MSLTPDRPAASGGSTLCLFASKQTQGLFGEWRSAQVQITLEWSQGWMCVHLWVEWRVSQSLIQVVFFYSFILFPSLVIKDKTNYKWSHFMRKVNAVFDFTPSDPTSNPPTTTPRPPPPPIILSWFTSHSHTSIELLLYVAPLGTICILFYQRGSSPNCTQNTLTLYFGPNAKNRLRTSTHERDHSDFSRHRRDQCQADVEYSQMTIK